VLGQPTSVETALEPLARGKKNATITVLPRRQRFPSDTTDAE